MSDSCPFKKWLDFLIFTNENIKNRQILTRFFFVNFSKDPLEFYNFLIFLKENILVNTTETEKIKLAEKYLLVLSPLCERFGIFDEKNVLDDLCFKITEPESYLELDKIFLAYKSKSENIIEKIVQEISKFFTGKKFHFEIRGRYKSIYSIHKKTELKLKKNALQLNDIFAFRIVLNSNSIKKCFQVLDLLHDNFQPIASFFKDYITIPKINGYQSLHTGLNNIVDDFDLPVEIQIRTKTMNEFAEKGLAAHWFYSIEKKTKLLTEKEKELLSYYSSLSQKEKTTIYCLSLHGDLFCMEKGSTVLDFAYSIHTELGKKAKIAIINGEEKPLNWKLKEGDIIEIVKSHHIEVEPRWIHYVHTPLAMKKITESLKIPVV